MKVKEYLMQFLSLEEISV